MTRSRCFAVGLNGGRPRFDDGCGFAFSGIFAPPEWFSAPDFTLRAQKICA
jgi:hypothetical protein